MNYMKFDLFTELVAVHVFIDFNRSNNMAFQTSKSFLATRDWSGDILW